MLSIELQMLSMGDSLCVTTCNQREVLVRGPDAGLKLEEQSGLGQDQRTSSQCRRLPLSA